MLNGRRAYRSVRAALSAAERGAVHRALASLRSGLWSLSFELACTLEAVNPPRPVGPGAKTGAKTNSPFLSSRSFLPATARALDRKP